MNEEKNIYIYTHTHIHMPGTVIKVTWHWGHTNGIEQKVHEDSYKHVQLIFGKEVQAYTCKK